MGGICDRGQRCHQTAIGGVGARKEGRYASRDVWTSTELSKSSVGGIYEGGERREERRERREKREEKRERRGGEGGGRRKGRNVFGLGHVLQRASVDDV